ncbi:Vacuolar protein sorting-associated protein 4 [Pseudolycoriella hygida]|uniref:Vacuolar protein sorting-associated protein 4 n=1 Tax=Pseudolycoriella hygida TaxID=35572 RepID=A0A9Q0S0K6_9DIPT|nr:Vacuolar protein sorting-associated protein 4 [Pseudolycoriella hygida]
MARSKKPSIIFIDEIDAVASKRTELDNSRGTKTELFLLMASTNCPQHLDSALIRRFDKLIYVPLPEEGARMEIFKKKLSDIKSDELSDDKLKSLAAKTAGFGNLNYKEAVRDANPTVDPKEVAELEKFAEEKGHGKVHYNRDLPKPRRFVGTIVDFFAEFFA